jgi:hypothetical protein
MDPQDMSSWRRLPGPGEPPSPKDRGIRYVRRLSNWTAAALVAATAVTAGYFARGSAHTAQPAATVTGAKAQAPASGQPCVTVPVATSGGSGVTTQAPVRTCGPAGSGTRPVVIYVKSGERGDG